METKGFFTEETNTLKFFLVYKDMYRKWRWTTEEKINTNGGVKGKKIYSVYASNGREAIDKVRERIKTR